MRKGKQRPDKPRKKAQFSEELLKAAKAAGFTNEQISAVKDEESLRALVIKVRPQAILDREPRPKEPKPKTPPEPIAMVSREKDFSMELSPQAALTWKRGDYEQSELDRFVNRNTIKNLVRVEITRGYVPNKTSKYETKFTIHYKEPK